MLYVHSDHVRHELLKSNAPVVQVGRNQSDLSRLGPLAKLSLQGLKSLAYICHTMHGHRTSRFTTRRFMCPFFLSDSVVHAA